MDWAWNKYKDMSLIDMEREDLGAVLNFTGLLEFFRENIDDFPTMRPNSVIEMFELVIAGHSQGATEKQQESAIHTLFTLATVTALVNQDLGFPLGKHLNIEASWVHAWREGTILEPKAPKQEMPPQESDISDFKKKLTDKLASKTDGPRSRHQLFYLERHFYKKGKLKGTTSVGYVPSEKVEEFINVSIGRIGSEWEVLSIEQSVSVSDQIIVKIPCNRSRAFVLVFNPA